MYSIYQKCTKEIDLHNKHLTKTTKSLLKYALFDFQATDTNNYYVPSLIQNY